MFGKQLQKHKHISCSNSLSVSLSQLPVGQFQNEILINTGFLEFQNLESWVIVELTILRGSGHLYQRRTARTRVLKKL